MRDPSERSEPAPKAPADRRRRPRFALPTDHHDERTSERIEAFIEGPQATRRHRRRHLRSDALVRPRRVVPLVTRADWDVALHHEDARFIRYGRPATVLVIELRAVAPEVLDRLGPRVGSIIREHARETDLVARVSRDRFHVLLPETLDADAAAFFERVTTATDALFGSDADRPLTIVGAAVTPARGGTLAEALRRAGDGLVSADQGRDEVVEFGGGVVRDPGVDR